MNLLRISSVISLLFSAQLQAAITTQFFGDGTTDLVSITALGTDIGAHNAVAPNYLAQNSSNTAIRFRRHMTDDGNPETTDPCFYWFRSNGDPSQFPATESWDNVYWSAWDIECAAYIDYFDGAEYGSDNFVLLTRYNAGAIAGEYSGNSDPYDDEIVGVLQYHLDADTGTAKLLAYAVDPAGLTFAQGVAAIQGIPEPSVSLLGALGMGALAIRRRR
jgi:hypothetical protein